MDRRRQTSSGAPSHQAVLISLHRFSLHRTCEPFQLNSGPLRGSAGVRPAPKPAELPDFRGVLISRPVRRRCKGLPGHTPQNGGGDPRHRPTAGATSQPCAMFRPEPFTRATTTKGSFHWRVSSARKAAPGLQSAHSAQTSCGCTVARSHESLRWAASSISESNTKTRAA